MSEPLADDLAEGTLNSASCLGGDDDVIKRCLHGVRDVVQCHVGHCARSLRSVALKRKILARSQRRRKYLRRGCRIEKHPGDKALHLRPSGAACVQVRSFLSSGTHSLDDCYSCGVSSSCTRRSSRVELRSAYENEEASDDTLMAAPLPSVFIKRVNSFRISRMGSSRESRSSWSGEGMRGLTLPTLTAQQSEEDHTELVDFLLQPTVSSLSLLHRSPAIVRRSSSVSKVAREDQHTPRTLEGGSRASYLVDRLGLDNRGSAAKIPVHGGSLSAHGSAMVGSALRDFRTPLSLSVRFYGTESYLESTLGEMALRQRSARYDLGGAHYVTPLGHSTRNNIRTPATNQLFNPVASMHNKRSSFIAGVTPLALRSLAGCGGGGGGGLLVSPKVSLLSTSITPLMRATHDDTCGRNVCGHPLKVESPQRSSSSSYEFSMGVPTVRGHCTPLRQSVATPSSTALSSTYLHLQKPVYNSALKALSLSNLALGSKSAHRPWRGDGAQQSTTSAAAGRCLPFLPTAAAALKLGPVGLSSASSVASAILEELAKSSGRRPKTLSTPSDPWCGEEPANGFVSACASRDVPMPLPTGVLSSSLVSPSPFRCGTFLRSVYPPFWCNSNWIDEALNERTQRGTSETGHSSTIGHAATSLKACENTYKLTSSLSGRRSDDVFVSIAGADCTSLPFVRQEVRGGCSQTFVSSSVCGLCPTHQSSGAESIQPSTSVSAYMYSITKAPRLVSLHPESRRRGSLLEGRLQMTPTAPYLYASRRLHVQKMQQTSEEGGENAFMVSCEKVSDLAYNDEQCVISRASSMATSCGVDAADDFDDDGGERRRDKGLEDTAMSGSQPSSGAAAFVEGSSSTREVCEDEAIILSAAVKTVVHTDIPQMEERLTIQTSPHEQRRAVVSGCNSLTVEVLNGGGSGSTSSEKSKSDLDLVISAVAMKINHDELLQGEGFVSVTPEERSASCEYERHDCGEISLTANERDLFEERDHQTLLSTDSMPSVVRRNVHVCVPIVHDDVVVSQSFAADPVVAAVHVDPVAVSLSSMIGSATQGADEEANDASLSFEDVCVTSVAVARRPSSFVFPSLRPAFTPPTHLVGFVDTAIGPTSVNTPFSSPPRRYTRRRTAVISRLVFEDTSSSDEDDGDGHGFMLVDVIDGQPRVSVEDRRRRSCARVVVPRVGDSCNTHTASDDVTPEEVTIWRGGQQSDISGAPPKRRQGCPCIVM